MKTQAERQAARQAREAKVQAAKRVRKPGPFQTKTWERLYWLGSNRPS